MMALNKKREASEEEEQRWREGIIKEEENVGLSIRLHSLCSHYTACWRSEPEEWSCFGLFYFLTTSPKSWGRGEVCGLLAESRVTGFLFSLTVDVRVEEVRRRPGESVVFIGPVQIHMGGTGLWMSSLKQGTPMTYSIRQRSELSSESFQIFCMFNIWIKAAELMFLLLENLFSQLMSHCRRSNFLPSA